MPYNGFIRSSTKRLHFGFEGSLSRKMGTPAKIEKYSAHSLKLNAEAEIGQVHRIKIG